ncbi:unnamed protein product [Paramecium primaurelia]|uniref:Uncharacterized protein n=1 Tax=Paramecium primaurelia TaxID=5886 RepID=A0A8S1M854_PARPR|nr:unnamed protein product [Paramecium primaurelia]
MSKQLMQVYGSFSEHVLQKELQKNPYTQKFLILILLPFEKETVNFVVTIFQNSNGYSKTSFLQILLCFSNQFPYFSIFISSVDLSDIPSFQITLTETVDNEESKTGKSNNISKITQTFQTQIGMDFKIKSLELSRTIYYSPLVLQVPISTLLKFHPSSFKVRV